MSEPLYFIVGLVIGLVLGVLIAPKDSKPYYEVMRGNIEVSPVNPMLLDNVLLRDVTIRASPCTLESLGYEDKEALEVVHLNQPTPTSVHLPTKSCFDSVRVECKCDE